MSQPEPPTALRVDAAATASPPGGSRRGEVAFAVWVTAGYALLLGLGLARHEVWRDEAHVWLLARRCTSLAELLYHTELEAHGPLWPLVNYLAARITSWPYAMQVLHGLMALAHVYVVVRLAPWARWQRLLYVVGYYTLFEYGMISRDYVWMVPLVLLFVHYAVQRPTATWLGFGLLTAASTANIYTVMIVLGLLPWYGYHLWRSGILQRPAARWRVAAGLAMTMIALAGTLYVITVRYHQNVVNDPWIWGWQPERASVVVQWYFMGLCPLPAPILEFWNTSRVSSPILRLGLGLALLLWIGWLLRDRWPALVVWAMGSGGILLFSYCKFIGHLRHFGYYYIVFVAAWWLAAQPPAWWRPPANRLRARLRNYTLAGLLAVQAVAGIFAWGMDLAVPFSGGRAAAQQISALRLTSYELVADPPYWVDSILFYLDHDVWLPAKHSHGDWSVYDRTWFTVTPESLLRDAITLSQHTGRPVVLVVPKPLANELLQGIPRGASAALAGQPVLCIEGEESFWIYLVQAGASAPVAMPPS